MTWHSRKQSSCCNYLYVRTVQKRIIIFPRNFYEHLLVTILWSSWCNPINTWSWLLYLMNTAVVNLAKEYSPRFNFNIMFKIHEKIRKVGESMLKFSSYWLQSASTKYFTTLSVGTQLIYTYWSVNETWCGPKSSVRSCNASDGIVTDYIMFLKTEDSGLRFPATERQSFLIHNVQTGRCFPLTSYPRLHWNTFPKIKCPFVNLPLKPI
jgi:hypothetical protein